MLSSPPLLLMGVQAPMLRPRANCQDFAQNPTFGNGAQCRGEASRVSVSMETDGQRPFQPPAQRWGERWSTSALPHGHWPCHGSVLGLLPQREFCNSQTVNQSEPIICVSGTDLRRSISYGFPDPADMVVLTKMAKAAFSFLKISFRL